MNRDAQANGYGGGQGPGAGYGDAWEDDTIDLGELLQTLLRNSRLIAAIACTVLMATLAWTATRTPAYKAVATLLLERDEAAGGVLSEIASLTADPAAEAEMAIIRSRSLAETTAAAAEAFPITGRLFDGTRADFDPVAGPVAASGGAGGSGAGAADRLGSMMDRLGLATTVEAFDRRPSAGMWRAVTGVKVEPHRLRARLAVLPDQGRDEHLPEGLDVIFSDAGAGAQTVRIVPHGGFLFPSDPDEGVRAAYSPGRPIEAFGHILRLDASGAFAGRRYRVSRKDEERAVLDLLEATSASESGRKTNVVNIIVQAASPYVAAETANALAKNYIRRSVQIGQQKAHRTVNFIKGQLEEQLALLMLAEDEVAGLQREHPETISLSDFAKALIDQLSALELERTQLDLARMVLEQATGHLDRGDHEALARLGQETPSLLTLGYIKELATLETESLRLDRTDVAGYKQLLQAEELRLRAVIERAGLEILRLESGLASVASGDAYAIARFAASVPGGDAGSIDLAAYFTSLAELDAELARMRGSLMPDNPAVLALVGSRDEFIGTITAQVRGALVGARAALAGTRALHQDYARSIAAWPAQERGTIDEAVGTLRARVRLSLAAQASGLSDRIAAVDVKLAELDDRLGALPQSQLDLAGATRDLRTHSEIVAFLKKSEQQAQITAAATSAAAVLIDPAVPPAERSFPRVTLFTALGAFLGLLLGCACAIARNALQAALHTEAEVERASGLPVLGSVPDFERGRTRIKGIRKGDRILPMRADPNGPQAEAYRSIRASLRQALHGEDALQTLACTSCMIGEGKTVTNADLAIVFAKAGRRVLLVDCDLRKPQIHNLFSAERSPGIGDVLEGGAAWRDCVQGTDNEHLDILPAGKTNSSPGELLAGERAFEVIEELKATYDLIVFDLPPAGVVADVANFASNLDALLLVYRSGKVPGRILTGMVNKLRQADVNVLGVIINAVYVSRALGGYGYGYGYGYGAEETEQGSA